VNAPRIALIDSPDRIYANLVADDARNRLNWGKPIGSVNADALCAFVYDGRRVQRNHDLIDALAGDSRFKVGPRVGVRFDQVQICLA